MRQMPSVTETTVPWVRTSEEAAEVLDLALDQFADFGRIQLHGSELLFRKASAAAMVCSLPRTDASQTLSPTSTLMPPIRSGSMVTVRVDLALESRGKQIDDLVALRIVHREGGADFRVHHALVLAASAASNCSRISASTDRRRLCTSTWIEVARRAADALAADRQEQALDLGGGDLGIGRSRPASADLSYTEASSASVVRPGRQRVALAPPAGTRLPRRAARWLRVRPCLI